MLAVIDATAVGVGRLTQTVSQGLQRCGERPRSALRAHHGSRCSGCDCVRGLRARDDLPDPHGHDLSALGRGGRHLPVQRAAGAVDRPGDNAGDAGCLRPALPGLRQDVERAAVRRDRALDSVLERGLWDGRRRHQPSVHLPVGAAERAVRGRLVDRGPDARAGVLRRAARCRDRDDRPVRRHESSFSFTCSGS